MLALRVSRVIPASPQQLHAVLSDITRMGELSPETTGARWLTKGERFIAGNRIGPLYRWATLCRVIENQPGSSFAFHVAWPSRTTWRYQLRAVDGGTEVTETMTKVPRQALPVRVIQRLAGVTDRREHLQAGMARTLERLEAVATR
nr:SRPBCC family protein [Rhodococcus sp. X156]